MKEQDFIKIISGIVNNDYIGDDCAYIKDLGIVITQDSLVEGVHFKSDWYTPRELGYKSAVVNISDILASGAEPAYLTIALSLPNNITDSFIEEFYHGLNDGAHGAKIVGGDITGSNKGIMISVTAIGKSSGRRISSRKNAKIGYVIAVTGKFGLSSAGLNDLINGRQSELIIEHKRPVLAVEFSKYISKNIKCDYAMMDTSDGLADALFKIAEASKVNITVDYNKIPSLNNISKADILFGGEDYNLVAAIPREIALKSGGIIIGDVKQYDGIRLDISGENINNYEDLSLYDHFNN